MNDDRIVVLWRESFPALRFAASRGLGTLAIVGLFVFQFAPGQGRAETCETKAQPSLAACRLQILSSDDQQNRDEAPVARSGRRRGEARPLADYQRGRGIDWHVPKNVDANDPGVRCLLMCPGGPLIIDLRVLIDGLPFRMKREQAIDQARADSKAIRKQSVERSDQAESAAATETQQSKDQPKDGNDTKTPESGAVETPANTQSPSVGRLARYIANQTDPVGRNEARWLLAQWTPGPALLALRDGFAAERASIAPVWHLLDRDQDGELSAAEFSLAEKRLISADVDGDEVVDMSELRPFTGLKSSKAKAHAKVRERTPWQILVPLDDHTDWDSLFSDLTEFYSPDRALAAGKCEVPANFIEQLDANGNQVWDADETSRLREIMPDLTIRIRFGSGDNSQTGLSVEQLSSADGSPSEILRASEDSIVAELGRCYLELSAAQLGGGSGTVSSDQVAIGAVMDGYPILRQLDRNHDRRLSLRERNSIGACLAAQDNNQNGALTADELALPVRISVTLGPHVDQILRTPAPAAALPPPEADRETSPAWFTLMDSNKDGDLSRSEFIGTRDQFKKLDTDGDGLLSGKEATQFDPENE